MLRKGIFRWGCRVFRVVTSRDVAKTYFFYGRCGVFVVVIFGVLFWGRFYFGGGLKVFSGVEV